LFELIERDPPGELAEPGMNDMNLLAINPPGPDGGIPFGVWIAVVAVIIVIGTVTAIRRRRK
jgi:hypothetical protein